MRMTMAIRRTMRVTAWLLLLAVIAIDASPYYILTTSRPMCFTVDGPRETSMLIEYYAPDLILLPEDDSGKLEQEQLARKMQVEAPDPEDGLDARFNQRYQQNLELIKKAGRTMSDMSIVVQQRGDTEGGNVAREWRRRDKEDTTIHDETGTGRIREELSKMKGSFLFTTGSFDGHVEMCFQSMSASSGSAVRIALNVTQQVAEEADPRRQKEEEDTRKAKTELTRMAGDLKGLERKVQLMLNNADYAKEQEAKFREQSAAMNRASRYWPMIHVAVLLVTGFTQANHFVRFFKSRHIF